MTVAEQIYRLLQEHDCVIVPGFGAFLKRYVAASIHPVSHKLSPPHYTVAFNAVLQVDDGLLIQTYQASLLEAGASKKAVSLFVANAKHALEKGESVYLNRLGVVYTSKEGNWIFEPESGSLTFNDFGLVALYARPIERTLEEETMAEPIKPKASRPVKSRSAGIRNTKAEKAPEKGTETKKKPIGLLIAAGLALLLLVPSIWLGVGVYTGNIQTAGLFGLLNLPSGKEALNIPTQDSTTQSVPEVVSEDTTTILTETEIVESEPVIQEEYEAPVEASPKQNNQELFLVPTAGHFYVVAGSFSAKNNALRYARQFRAEGVEAYVMKGRDGNFFKVVIGDLSSKAEADKLLDSLRPNYGLDLWALKY